MIAQKYKRFENMLRNLSEKYDRYLNLLLMIFFLVSARFNLISFSRGKIYSKSTYKFCCCNIQICIIRNCHSIFRKVSIQVNSQNSNLILCYPLQLQSFPCLKVCLTPRFLFAFLLQELFSLKVKYLKDMLATNQSL